MNDLKCQSNFFFLVGMLFALCLPFQAFAQKSNFVFDLAPGSFAVGFKVVNQYDYSRTYQSRIDALGNERTGPRGRPVQTSIWYPAVSKEKRQPMLFEEYVYLFADEEMFVEPSEKSKAEAIGILKRRFPQMSESALNNELKVKTNAFKNAEPATGSFPVIIYAPSLSAPSFENSGLCEYLASHGYIVVASPDMGGEFPPDACRRSGN